MQCKSLKKSILWIPWNDLLQIFPKVQSVIFKSYLFYLSAFLENYFCLFMRKGHKKIGSHNSKLLIGNDTQLRIEWSLKPIEEELFEKYTLFQPVSWLADMCTSYSCTTEVASCTTVHRIYYFARCSWLLVGPVPWQWLGEVHVWK